MEVLFRAIADGFTDDVYQRFTRVQMIAWSVADLLLVWVVLRISGYVRRAQRRPRIVLRYVLLGGSIFLTPLVPLVSDLEGVFRLECVIFVLQYAALLTSLVLEGPHVMRFLRAQVQA